MATAKQQAAQQALPTDGNPPHDAVTGEVKPEAPPNGEKKKISGKQIATNAATLQMFLLQNQAELEKFARGFLDPDAMIRLSLMALSRSPELAKCTLGSILRSLMDASALRIRPGGLNGRGYLVPRRNNKVDPAVWECHFDPGWRGLVDVARRSRQLKTIGAQVVREGDVFEYGYYPLPKLVWEPLRDGAEDRKVTAAFAVAELTDGAIQIEVIEGSDLEKIKKASAAQSGPWASWESEMCRKSAVKRLCKYLPVPADFDELDRAMAISDGADIGDRSVIETTGEESPQPTQAESIRNQLNAPGMSAADQIAALETEAEQVLSS